MFTLANLASLGALVALEIVLGIDNIIFLAILVGKLPAENRATARIVGLVLAMFFRILLLLFISSLMRLTTPLFTLFSVPMTGKGLILLAGGLFLIWKATLEMHHSVEQSKEPTDIGRPQSTMVGAIIQIVLIDLVFSIDSVITAVGMAQELWVMITAVVIAILVMLAFSKPIGEFILKHPTVKTLALAFLLMVGVLLVADAFGKHVDRAYLYFAMGFSLAVECLNMRLRTPSHEQDEA